MLRTAFVAGTNIMRRRRATAGDDETEREKDEAKSASSGGSPPWSALSLVLIVVVFAVIGRLGRDAVTRSLGKWGNLGRSISPFSSSPSGVTRLVTAEELSRHDGNQDPTLWLAILGEVFDVTKGERHYGAEGGYKGFVGKDGTRAFHTGHFNTPEGLTPDMSGLPDAAHLAIREWADFYGRDYAYVGKLAPGFYYDERGKGTEGKRNFEAAVARARSDKANAVARDAAFPACRARWSQQHGGEVWCDANKGYPRKDVSHVNGKPRVRCACFPDAGFSDQRQLYPGCPNDARRCAT